MLRVRTVDAYGTDAFFIKAERPESAVDMVCAPVGEFSACGFIPPSEFVVTSRAAEAPVEERVAEFPLFAPVLEEVAVAEEVCVRSLPEVCVPVETLRRIHLGNIRVSGSSVAADVANDFLHVADITAAHDEGRKGEEPAH